MSSPTNQSPNLFDALRQASRSNLSRLQTDERKHILTFMPSQLDDLGSVLFGNIQKGGICTLVVSGRGKWNPRSYYFEAARQAASRGRDITRLFLLPHRQYRGDTTLREHIAMDSDSGIKTDLLLIGDLLSKSAVPMLQGLDFGIWDDSIICNAVRFSNSDQSGLSEWRVSARPEDLQHGRDVISLLMNSAIRLKLDDTANEKLNLEEPMISTAPIVEFLSSVLCRGNHVSKDDCSWYHGIWQYLRVFNMVSTPTWHSDFYFDGLRQVCADFENPRILISGTADYSMLAHVLWICNQQNCKAEIVVLDLCETPLFLCRWYAKSVSAEVATAPADIMTFSPSKPIDCVVTDAFLTRFSPVERVSVVQKWHSLLVPAKGKVITTTRIETPAADGMVRATPAQSDSFRHRAIREANKWADFLSASPAEIGIRAQRYAERMVSYPIESINELEELFTRNGFVIDSLKSTDLPGEMVPTTYAEIIARKKP
jgi:hypothetical protein